MELKGKGNKLGQINKRLPIDIKPDTVKTRNKDRN